MSEQRTMYGHPCMSTQDHLRQAAKDRADAEALRQCAAKLRQEAEAMSNPAPPNEDARDNWGVPIFLPADPADHRPELDALVAMVREGCRGVVDLDDEDWRVVCDELTYQIARYLAKHETIKLPNLGTLDVTYGEHGPVGRLTLAPEARP